MTDSFYNTELSPAAQAVLDAMYEVNMDFGEENSALAAAALRETVNQLKFFCITEKYILAIATELEAQS
jgi:hypothetical protein